MALGAGRGGKDVAATRAASLALDCVHSRRGGCAVLRLGMRFCNPSADPAGAGPRFRGSSRCWLGAPGSSRLAGSRDGLLAVEWFPLA